MFLKEKNNSVFCIDLSDSVICIINMWEISEVLTNDALSVS